MRISDYQRRRILHLIKHFKSAHKQQAAYSGAHSWNASSSPAPGRLSTSRAASMPHRSVLVPTSPKAAMPVNFTPCALLDALLSQLPQKHHCVKVIP